MNTSTEARDPSGVEKYLQYEFSNKELLREALRHSSYVNELAHENLQDNERLEFLGDAVLNLIVGHILMRRYPDVKEGELSRRRANLVNESQLAAMARSFELGAYIQLGKGEIQTEGREKNSILADTFEALVAAIYLDGGFDAAFTFIETNFLPLMDRLHSTANNYDYKSQLQEKVQVGHGAMPDYHIIREDGPDHDKTFWVELKVLDIETQGSGKNKKAAEQEAARKALEILEEESP
ncbi:MAG: ribonuclease III [Deltaproteobacteria bacterium]|nr:ribonuclease III [Deltaproteobacteria bacterium]MBW2480815.1 ribonuclease III [Deltaproteobacteria bacterium]